MQASQLPGNAAFTLELTCSLVHLTQTRAKTLEKRYQVEFQLMQGTIHDMGVKINRGHLGGGPGGIRGEMQPSSWLGLQRKTVSPHSLLHRRLSHQISDG